VEGEVALKVPVHDRSDHWKNPDKLWHKNYHGIHV
jgi:hypothetical protein